MRKELVLAIAVLSVLAGLLTIGYAQNPDGTNAQLGGARLSAAQLSAALNPPTMVAFADKNRRPCTQNSQCAAGRFCSQDARCERRPPYRRRRPPARPKPPPPDCSMEEEREKEAREAVKEHCPAFSVPCVRASYNFRYAVEALLACREGSS